MTEHKSRERFLKARITFLELTERSIKDTAAPAHGAGGRSLALMRAENCPIHFYRYLYAQVGRPHHWQTRRKQSDAAVKEILDSADTLLHILYCGGCPAGFSETLLRQQGARRIAEIVYFGLTAEYQGLHLSRFFLGETLQAAWAADADKIIIQTNSLDNPRALQLYQQAGFVPIGTQDVEIAAWE